jgi:hypothetical protein
MADYSFFIMGVIALITIAVVVGSCILLAIGCIIAKITTSKPSSGIISFILAAGSFLTFGISAIPALIFGLIGIKQKAYPRLSWASVILSSCVILLVFTVDMWLFPDYSGFEQEIVASSDKALIPYQTAIAVDRQEMGFPPLSTDCDIKIETVDRDNWDYEYPPPAYDVMLHFYEITNQGDFHYIYRTVALKMTADGYKWIGEQICYHGPNTYTTIDGTFNEQIAITSENEQIAFIGRNLEGTAISYSGNDSRLPSTGNHAQNLSIAQITPILQEWGYNYGIHENVNGH